MRAPLLCLAAASALPGCMTHRSLRANTVRTAATLTDLNHQQVLDNVARFAANPAAVPSVSVVNAGTVTVADQLGGNANATYAPTLTSGQQGGGALPILSLLFNPSGSRTLTENWSLAPVTDVDNLRRIRCAFQLLVRGKGTTDCEDCKDLLGDFYLGENDRLDCLIPRGWYCVGGKKDVPDGACHVGRHGDLYAWVTPDGLEGLARFTMTVIDLATGKPHAPMKTVVKTYKADGSLDTTQVTTTEVDREALDKWRKGAAHRERPRDLDAPVVNPGLFFVPR